MYYRHRLTGLKEAITDELKVIVMAHPNQHYRWWDRSTNMSTGAILNSLRQAGVPRVVIGLNFFYVTAIEYSRWSSNITLQLFDFDRSRFENHALNSLNADDLVNVAEYIILLKDKPVSQPVFQPDPPINVW